MRFFTRQVGSYIFQQSNFYRIESRSQLSILQQEANVIESN